MFTTSRIIALLLVLGLSSVALACPNCRDTIANSADGAAALPAGFNYSIYWMLLGLLGVMGMVARTIYKGIQSTPCTVEHRQ